MPGVTASMSRCVTIAPATPSSRYAPTIRSPCGDHPSGVGTLTTETPSASPTTCTGNEYIAVIAVPSTDSIGRRYSTMSALAAAWSGIDPLVRRALAAGRLASGEPGGTLVVGETAPVVRRRVGVERLLLGAQVLGHVDQVDAQPVPRVRTAAHRGLDDVRGLEMGRRLRVTHLPALEALIHAGLGRRAPELDHRDARLAS